METRTSTPSPQSKERLQHLSGAPGAPTGAPTGAQTGAHPGVPCTGSTGTGAPTGVYPGALS